MSTTFHCELCGYLGEPGLLPCGCEDGSCTVGVQRQGCGGPGIGCPVCLDGKADPWAVIREIRALVGSPEGLVTPDIDPNSRPMTAPFETVPSEAREKVVAEADDPFETEWELLRLSILSIWSDLTAADLSIAAGDRVRFEGLLRRRYGYGTALAHQLTIGLLDLHERFNGQWEIVEECIPKHWPEISESEVQRMNGTMGELAGLVERRYQLASGEGRRRVAGFLHQIDYPLLVRLHRGAGMLQHPGTLEASDDVSSDVRRDTAS